MKGVFVDTQFFVAISAPHDSWHKLAVEAQRNLHAEKFVTTDEVLGEFLTAYSMLGDYWRHLAVRTAQHILENKRIHVVAQSREGFLDTLSFYSQRPDKQYSFVDCRSMIVMRSEGIHAVLTNDHHFEQEGFQLLMSR